MRSKFIAISFSFFLHSFVSWAGSSVDSVNFFRKGKIGNLKIQFKDVLNDIPELVVNGNVIRITIPNGKLASKIQKK